MSVRRKLNAMPAVFAGKSVLLVDDSIVRGTTMSQIVDMVRAAGARKVRGGSLGGGSLGGLGWLRACCWVGCCFVRASAHSSVCVALRAPPSHPRTQPTPPPPHPLS